MKDKTEAAIAYALGGAALMFAWWVLWLFLFSGKIYQ